MASEFKPTLKMAANAKRGLKLRDKFDRGGTEVGVRRAHQLADRVALSATDVKSMHSYFARHKVDKQGAAHEWGSITDPSAGYIAWLLWGGDDGKAWADRHAATIDKRCGIRRPLPPAVSSGNSDTTKGRPARGDPSIVQPPRRRVPFRDPAVRIDGPATAATPQVSTTPLERTEPEFPPCGVRQ